MLSIVSLFYGTVTLGILTALAGLVSPILGSLVGLIWLAQLIFCVLGVLPLSRFWLPEQAQDVMVRLVNFGLGAYHWAESRAEESASVWVLLLVRGPVLLAKAAKYVVLLPAYELAKVFVGDRVVGVVTTDVSYFAEAAEWYIEELLGKDPQEMVDEELYHLSYLYRELGQVGSYGPA